VITTYDSIIGFIDYVFGYLAIHRIPGLLSADWACYQNLVVAYWTILILTTVCNFLRSYAPELYTIDTDITLSNNLADK
jgi:hypothetical protein